MLEARCVNPQERKPERMKDLFLKTIRSLPIGAKRQEALLFFLKLGYWPNFDVPVSFNEKVNKRKLTSIDSLLVTCSDKDDFIKTIRGQGYVFVGQAA